MAKNILFDFDGTVYNTEEGITKSIRYALNKRGMDAPLSELRVFCGPPLVAKFMEVYGFEMQEAEQAVADFRERYLPTGVYESCIFPGMKELLAALRADGRRLAVSTSKPETLARMLLKREGADGLFDVICGSTPGANDDAKWQVVTRAMQHLNAKPEDTLLVGDTMYDVAGAHRCGIKCVAVRYGCAAEGELEKAGADWIVDDIKALQSFLMK